MNQAANTTKKPWPTQKAMRQIYEKNLWGKNNSKFYSGEGSHNSEIVKPHLKVVQEFLTSFQQPLTVCDLGCGDFNIGKQLMPFTKKYIAVDIVEDLIAYNKQQFKAEHLEFLCLDIAKDTLPKATVVIVRQVLQHLSNAEIQQILPKLYDYKYVILTEHLPKGNFTPNIDIISGQGTRLKKQSGVNILESPFYFKSSKITELLSVKDDNFGGVVKTWLLEN